MTIYSVHHSTVYRFRRPVRLGQHQMLFRPRDSFDQRLLDCHLVIRPDPVEIRWIHDVFGNCVALAEFATSTDLLHFETTIRLEHTPENAPDFRIEEYAREHPFTYDIREFSDLEPYMRRQYPNEARVDDWLSRFVERGGSRPTGQLLMTLNKAIAEGFSYQRRTEQGIQPPSETLTRQRGTCRDFALLMMEAARSLGFAARFITGYIYIPDRDGPVRMGGGSTHAWCSIYVPGSGWVEFDPTNGIVGNRDLIRVGVARTPSQAIPLSGTYLGHSDDHAEMEVSVNVKAEGASPY